MVSTEYTESVYTVKSLTICMLHLSISCYFMAVIIIIIIIIIITR